MPRAPPTPNNGDTLSLGNLYEHMPLNANSGAAPPPAPASHPSPAILNVHITNYIQFKVTSTGKNFSKWRQIFIFLLTMYKAMDHVTEGTAPSDPDDDWCVVDIHISLWFMATLSDDLHRLAASTDGLAYNTCSRLHRFFYDNQTSRYMYLSKALLNCPHGDMSIATYASKLQGIADDMAAIGRPLDERDLTLQLLDGKGASSSGPSGGTCAQWWTRLWSW
jgi:hypothetical protein